MVFRDILISGERLSHCPKFVCWMLCAGCQPWCVTARHLGTGDFLKRNRMRCRAKKLSQKKHVILIPWILFDGVSRWQVASKSSLNVVGILSLKGVRCDETAQS